MTYAAFNAIERTYRRVLMALGYGWVSQSSDEGAFQSLQVTLSTGEILDSTPRVMEFGFSSMPPLGSNAVLVFPGGDRSNGIVIATGTPESRPQGLLPGETIIYDTFGHTIKLSSTGIAVVGNVTITGSLHVTQTIGADAEISSGGINLTAHEHTGVQTGSDNTGPPTG